MTDDRPSNLIMLGLDAPALAAFSVDSRQLSFLGSIQSSSAARTADVFWDFASPRLRLVNRVNFLERALVEDHIGSIETRNPEHVHEVSTGRNCSIGTERSRVS